jgi:hypothetical protein
MLQLLTEEQKSSRLPEPDSNEQVHVSRLKRNDYALLMRPFISIIHSSINRKETTMLS